MVAHMSKARISASPLLCTVRPAWLCVWVSDSARVWLGHNDTLQQVTRCRRKRKTVKREAVMMKMPAWALYISPLHQPAAWLLIQGNLSSGGLKRKCCSFVLEKHAASPLPACCPDNKLLWAAPCTRQAGQRWINDIWEALPYLPSAVWLSCHSTGALTYLASRTVAFLPLHPSLTDIKAVKLKVSSYILAQVQT